MKKNPTPLTTLRLSEPFHNYYCTMHYLSQYIHVSKARTTCLGVWSKLWIPWGRLGVCTTVSLPHGSTSEWALTWHVPNLPCNRERERERIQRDNDRVKGVNKATYKWPTYNISTKDKMTKHVPCLEVLLYVPIKSDRVLYSETERLNETSVM